MDDFLNEQVITKNVRLPNDKLQYLVQLYSLGNFNKALEETSRLLCKFPNSVTLYNIKGASNAGLQNFEEAIKNFQKAISIKPNFAEAYNNMGLTQQNKGDFIGAIESYKQAINIKSDYAEAFNNMGFSLLNKGNIQSAAHFYKQAIKINPNYADAHNNLGVSLQKLGRFEEAELSYRNAINIKPDFIECCDNLLYLQSIHNFNYKHYLQDIRSYVDILRKKITFRFSQWSCLDNPKNLRVGFVSGDFKNHPVGYFLEGLLNELKSTSIEVYAYTTTFIEDDLTLRIKPYVSDWKSLWGKTDDDCARIVHNDNIHILIDLAGHTDLNRLPIFARKPAPIQVSWLGYWASTGVPEIDYILGDQFITPYSEAHHFSEKIWQLPESYLCFTEPNVSVDVKSLPAQQNGYVTFGCFNKLLKMTDENVSVRARVLNSIPKSKLFLKDSQLQHQTVRDQIISKFEKYGISEDQLILEGSSPRKEYLECYNRVDIVLSPYPYGGGTTNVEALWMGVPAIIKRGDYLLSHLGETIANNAGLTNWIANDEDDYVAKAIKFSSNLDDLGKLRQGLRKQVLTSSLLNPKKFTKHFETALWGMWKKLQTENKNV